MTWQIVFIVCFVHLTITNSQGEPPKCSLVFEEGGLMTTGYVKDKIKTKTTTEGPVCPDKCDKELLTEINTNCEANFTAHCCNTCDMKLPPFDKEDTKSFENCCVIQGLNKNQDFNFYTFAVTEIGVTLVNYGGSPSSTE